MNTTAMNDFVTWCCNVFCPYTVLSKMHIYCIGAIYDRYHVQFVNLMVFVDKWRDVKVYLVGS